MPELPEVEGFRRAFERHAAGKRVLRVRGDESIARNATIAQINGALRDRTFGTPERVGKWLVARAEGPAVLLHFGMTGDILWERDDHPHDRLSFEFDDGVLRYR